MHVYYAVIPTKPHTHPTLNPHATATASPTSSSAGVGAVRRCRRCGWLPPALPFCCCFCFFFRCSSRVMPCTSDTLCVVKASQPELLRASDKSSEQERKKTNRVQSNYALEAVPPLRRHVHHHRVDLLVVGHLRRGARVRVCMRGWISQRTRLYHVTPPPIPSSLIHPPTSNMASFSKFSIIDRSPRAPVLRRIACRAMARRALSLTWSTTSSSPKM